MSEWIKFDKTDHCFQRPKPPFDGVPFICFVWEVWVGLAIYSRHYDATGRCPGKYEFFYVTKDPEETEWEIKLEEDPFPITHWMPLPNPPEDPL